MEILQTRMKSMGAMFKRRSSVTSIEIAPELSGSSSTNANSNQRESMDPYEELYKVKKELQEKEKELLENQDMLKDYISNRINISRDLSSEDQIFRLKNELKKLGYQEPQPIRSPTPPVSMEEYNKIQSEIRNLTHCLQKKDQYYESRIHSLKTQHAEEIASLNLDIFELRDQLKSNGSGSKVDSRLIIELSTQVSQLSTEVEELQLRLASYENV